MAGVEKPVFPQYHFLFKSLIPVLHFKKLFSSDKVLVLGRIRVLQKQTVRQFSRSVSYVQYGYDRAINVINGCIRSGGMTKQLSQSFHRGQT